MLLLQTVSYALETDWIVLYLPRLSSTIDSSAPYTYHASSGTFHQPTLAIDAMRKLVDNNGKKLDGLVVKTAVGPIKEGMSISEAVRVGAKDEKFAVEVLEAVLEAVGAQDKSAPCLELVVVTIEAQADVDGWT